MQGQGGGKEIQGFFERVAEWKSEGGKSSAEKIEWDELVTETSYVFGDARGVDNGMEIDIRTVTSHVRNVLSGPQTSVGSTPNNSI